MSLWQTQWDQDQENRPPWPLFPGEDNDSEAEDGLSPLTITPTRRRPLSSTNAPFPALASLFRRNEETTGHPIYRGLFTSDIRRPSLPYGNGIIEFIGNVLCRLPRASDTVRTLQSVQGGSGPLATRTRIEIYVSSKKTTCMSGNLHCLQTCEGSLI